VAQLTAHFNNIALNRGGLRLHSMTSRFPHRQRQRDDRGGVAAFAAPNTFNTQHMIVWKETPWLHLQHI
jgi:hypothetical protein